MRTSRAGPPRSTARPAAEASGSIGAAPSKSGATEAGVEADPARRLLDAAPPLVLIDPRGRILLANRRYREFARALPGPVSDSTLPGGLVPGDLIARAGRSGEAVEADRVIETAAGPRHFRIRCEPAGAGPPARIAITLLDLERERGALDRAARVEERFYDIGRLISDWIWEVDANFEFIFISPRVTEILGIPLRLLFGRNLFEVGTFEPDGAPGALAPGRESRTPFSDVLYSVTDIRDQPRLFRMSGVPVFDSETGEFAGYRGTGVDITRQRQTEEALSKNQALLQGIIENTPTAICLKGLDGRYLLVNRQFEHYCFKTYGLREDDILGRRPHDIFPREVADLTVASDAEMLETGRLVQREVTIELWDGAHSFLVSRFPILDADGEASAICVIESDITDLKERQAAIEEAEKASRAALAAAEIANRAKSEFLANVSHELRTPLNAVLGFSEVMKNELFGPLGSDRYREYAADIFESGGHLLSLISDILDVSKIEAGKFQLEESEVCLGEVLGACLRLVATRAEQGRVALEMAPTDDLPRLRADSRKLKQIVLNLLSNAVKFTPGGGHVKISAGPAEDGGLSIVIADDGIGIAACDLPKVMEPFGQADSRLNRRYEGTGLGLSIARSYARAHGGELVLDSEPGVGTTATVHLPRERLVADAPEAPDGG